MEPKKGFAHPEILIIGGLIILVVIVLLSGVLSPKSQPTDTAMMGDEKVEDTSMEAEDSMMEESMMMADMPLTNIYTHPAGATIMYPDGWILDDSSDTPSIVYKDANAESSSGNGAGVLMMTNDVPEGMSFEIFAAGSGDAFGEEFGADLGEPTEVEINGVTAYMYDFTFIQSGVELTANLYFVPAGDGDAYALFATAENSLFSKYEKVLTDMVHSFEVK